MAPRRMLVTAVRTSGASARTTIATVGSLRSISDSAPGTPASAASAMTQAIFQRASTLTASSPEDAVSTS